MQSKSLLAFSLALISESTMSACGGASGGAGTSFAPSGQRAATVRASSKTNLFVESFTQIGEYTMSGDLVRIITDGFTSTGTSTGGLAVDAAGYLYAITGDFSIGVYAPSSRSLVRTISKGIGWPFSLATDASGNLYVGNGENNTVTVYPPGGSAPSLTISQGIDDPASIAVDSHGNLYVANLFANTVTVYSPAGAPSPLA